MTDYTELVKKLRDLHRDPRPASAEWLFENQVALYDAAAAIEDLVKRVKCAEEKIKLYKGEADLYKDLYRSAHEAFMKEHNGSHGTLANLQSLMQSPIPHNLCPNRAEEVYNLCANYPKKPDSSENPNS